MDELREQHALGEEIASAITNAPLGEPLDEADLEEELEGMEQEAMDERMLKTGTLPVQGLPAVGNQPREFHFLPFLNLRTTPDTSANNMNSKRKTRRRRRRRRAAEATSPKWPCRFAFPRKLRCFFILLYYNSTIHYSGSGRALDTNQSITFQHASSSFLSGVVRRGKLSSYAVYLDAPLNDLTFISILSKTRQATLLSVVTIGTQDNHFATDRLVTACLVYSRPAGIIRLYVRASII